MVDSLINSCLNVFFHSDEINQNPTVVPVNRSYAITTKYGRKAIVVLVTLGVLTEDYLVIPYQNVEDQSKSNSSTC